MAEKTAPTFIAVTTDRLVPPKDDLFRILDVHLPALLPGDIVAITSKVLSIHQGRCVRIDNEDELEALIEREADAYLPKASSKYGISLTIKDYTLIPRAGVDFSNGNGFYILWPDAPSHWAGEIGRHLRRRNRLKQLGIIITDSHCIPLRRGVVGISCGFHGFAPIRDYRGEEDLFGSTMRISQSNLPDSLASAAVNLMGEGSECCPIVVIRNWPRVEFIDDHKPAHEALYIAPEEDLFRPLLEVFGKSGR